MAAEKKRPDNAALLAALDEFKNALIAETAGVFAPVQPVSAFVYQLQRMVRPDLPFADVAVWRQRLEKAERAVCRVELTQGAGEGTGFLVAKDLVMTCRHVIKTLVGAAPATIADAVLRFDYKRNPDNKPIIGKEYRLSPNWLAASNDSIDYAILRVAGNPGDEQVGLSPESRGWLKLSTAVPQVGGPVQILQHPKTLPMKLAFGTVVATSAANCLEYNANTDEGSSGAPVSTADWKLVALHNAGGANNRGSLCAAILSDLEAKQVSTLLG